MPNLTVNYTEWWDPMTTHMLTSKAPLRPLDGTCSFLSHHEGLQETVMELVPLTFVICQINISPVDCPLFPVGPQPQIRPWAYLKWFPLVALSSSASLTFLFLSGLIWTFMKSPSGSHLLLVQSHKILIYLLETQASFLFFCCSVSSILFSVSLVFWTYFWIHIC